MASKTERTRFTPRLISLAVASCFATGAAYAQTLPTGAHAMSGIAGIKTVGSAMTVTTSAHRSIVNWQTFSIGSGAAVSIQQPGATSANLSRVVGSGGAIDPSVILGALQSNGRVFLLNPAGIVFGAGAQIDVAGLVASTLNLSNADFLGGRLNFTAAPGAGAVVNEGAINAATGGEVYLVGPSVTNSGIITSPKGEVILAAGNSVELVNPGTPNLRVEITAPDNEARNLGSIVADAGRVGIYAGLINHSGAIRADSALATEDGRIVLKATKNTTVGAGSVLSANGPSGGQVTVQSGDTTMVSGSISATGSAGKGGTVQVLGNRVGLDGNASIDVSGATGGGTALVGGGFQGKNPNVQNASRTWFGPNATIRADAIGNGNGGTVVVWSDDVTRAYGTISARGGKDSGDGGFVEVSSRGWLDFHAKVDTSAPKGRTGTLLLDPNDVVIEDCDCSTTGGMFSSGGAPSIWESTGGVASHIQWFDIDSNLASNNVIITTSGPGSMPGDITVAHGYSLTHGNLLQFVAHRNVNIDNSAAGISGIAGITGPGMLSMYAGWDGANAVNPVVQQGVGNINVNANITMGGNTLLRAGRDINVNSQDVSVVSSAGSRFLTVHAGNKVMLDHASLRVDVSGGEGAAATIKVLAGAGGVEVVSGNDGPSIFAQGGQQSGFPGGSASILIGSQEEPALGPILLRDGAFVHAKGGYGNTANGGDARIDVVSSSSITVQDDSGLLAEAGNAGNGTGVGGSSLVQLISNGDINMLNANGFGCFSCGSGVTAKAGDGDSGGGSAQATLSAGGNINAQNAFVGAEGRGAGIARVTATANGTVSITNNSIFLASHGFDSGPTAAQVNVIGNSVTIGGASSVVAFGGGEEGTTNGGAASVNVVATGGPLTINGAEGVGAVGGFGDRGGDAATTLSSAGLLTIDNTNTMLFDAGTGVFAVGGSGFEQGGNASVSITGQSITQTLSHVEALGGDGGDLSGSAVVRMIATGGNLILTGSSPAVDAPPEASFLVGTVIAKGGLGENFGSTAGGAEVLLGATGELRVTNEGVAAIGGAGEVRGGDARLIMDARGIFITDSHVYSEGGFSDVQGGRAETLLASAGNIEIRGTPGLAATVLARGGRVFFEDGAPGAGLVVLNLAGADSLVIIDDDSVQAFGGGIGSGSSGGMSSIFGTDAGILLNFVDRTEGGFRVNGVDGAITGSPAGFFVNGQPAIPGVNFLVVYNGVLPPDVPPPPPLPPPQTVENLPPFLEQVVTSLNEVADDLALKKEENTPTKEEKDKKKKEAECR